MLELLAPAGDIQSFYAAINCGADAVYLGFDCFNARMKACNFNESNIHEIVEKAHFFGVKVYVTVNTILQNSEINRLIEVVKTAVAAKVDAFLVQDLGVAKLLSDCFEGIVLHASTQMGIHNLYGAKVAQSMGIKRVVLSRETKLEDIKRIRENTDLEIEYFVQGALCVCFSGNCYLSSVEQNASGNRGLCKQLCRLPYTAELCGKKYEGFLLSAKDLCMAQSLMELARAGVTSFKIEGRMRRAEYVGQAVKIFRKLIDDVERHFDDGCVSSIAKTDAEKLKIAFNRGEYLCRAYLDDGVADVIDSKHSNHIGIEIGKVERVMPFKKDLFETEVKLLRPIENGDGLKFFENGKEMISLGVGEVKNLGKGRYSFITKTKVSPEWKINLISSKSQEREIAATQREVRIDMSVKAISGEPLKITAVYRNKDVCLKSTAKSDSVLENALNAVMSKDDIIKQCVKCGDSGFRVNKCSVETDGVFAAKSMINALRRRALQNLKERITEYHEPMQVCLNENNLQKWADIRTTISQRTDGYVRFVRHKEDLNAQTLDKNEIVALSPETYSVKEVQRLLETLCLSEREAALELPIIANGNDLRVLENLLESTGIKTLVSENIYGLYFSEKGYNVLAGQGHNAANFMTVYALKSLGAAAVIPSLEYPDMQSDGALPVLEAKSALPLMTFAHCPFKTLFGNDCAHCSYKNGLTLTRGGKRYNVRRTIVSRCYFSLSYNR